MSASLTNAISAGARSPEEYVYAARTPKAISSGRSFTNQLVFSPPPTPITSSTAWMPTSWSAMYGIVARMPVTATASESPLEPNRPRTKSEVVTYPCRWLTDHRRGRKVKTSGYTRIVYGTAKNPEAPAA